MRVFYAVWPIDRRLRAYLDGIRFLANPKEKECAHVTVRGPYSQRYNVCALSRIVEGAEVEITGVDTFWNNNGSKRQNTVFLSCASAALRRVWHKADYGYHPHLTLYDGPSRHVAQALVEVLKSHRWQLQFVSTGLVPILSTRGQMTLELRSSVDLELLGRVMGRGVSLQAIEAHDEVDRLGFISRLCADFNRVLMSPKRTPRPNALDECDWQSPWV